MIPKDFVPISGTKSFMIMGKVPEDAFRWPSESGHWRYATRFVCGYGCYNPQNCRQIPCPAGPAAGIGEWLMTFGPAVTLHGP